MLPDLELRVIEFLSEWMVSLLMPAKHLIESRSPHLFFMLGKEYWFRELYIGLKVAASFDRSESYRKTIDGQIRCITADFKPKGANVAWNVHHINVFIPAWMVPPIYHSLRRENVKFMQSPDEIGVRTLRPTWFEDETVVRASAAGSPNALDPMHGLRLTIGEDAIPLRDQPNFAALNEIAARGLLAFEAWQCNRSHISLKATIDVPLLGTVIEQNGGGQLDDSLMPVGWPLHLDGAVKQWCVHRTTTFQELTDLLSTYDMKRDLLELNDKAAQWGYGAVWNRWYMDSNTGRSMRQMWIDRETHINKKVTNTRPVTDNDLWRATESVANKPAAQLPKSTFLQALGTSSISNAPPQTASLALRASEEWERNICENQAFAGLQQMQTGRVPIIKKDGGEMLVAMVLDRPLADAQALVRDPFKQKQGHAACNGPAVFSLLHSLIFVCRMTVTAFFGLPIC